MKLRFNTDKILAALVIGTFLSLVFSLEGQRVLDFMLIRWQFLFPPILALMFLSLQPYLNFADAKTYFLSGAKIGAGLGLLIVGMHLVLAFATSGGIFLSSMPSTELLGFGFFVATYGLLGGISHYAFNRNVDPQRPDIYKRRYLAGALVVGAVAFAVCSLWAAQSQLDNVLRTGEQFLPLIVAVVFAVRSHHFGDNKFWQATMLGALVGGLLGITSSVISLLRLVLNVVLYPELTIDNGVWGTNLNPVVLFLLLAVVYTILYTIIGAATGLGSKVLKKVL